MVLRSILALWAVAASVFSPSARAASPPVLDPTVTVQVATIQTGADASSGQYVYTASYGYSSFGAYSANAPLSAMTGPVSVTSSAFGGNDPTVSASAQISGNPALYTGGDLTAEAYLGYNFEVTGPAGGYAPVDISASGNVSQDGLGASGALAEFSVSSPYPSYSFGLQEIAAMGSLAAESTGSPVTQFSLNQMYLLADNTPYLVTLETKAVSSYVDGAFLARALVDPTIQLDPLASVETTCFSARIWGRRTRRE